MKSINDIFSVKDKVILITGASSGLGKHFALTLSNAGAKVILSARRKKALDSLSKNIKNSGNECLVIPLDVSSKQSVTNLIEKSVNKMGHIDVLINNAGISNPEWFKDLSEESWMNVMETNLNGAFRVAKQVSDLMTKQGRPGSIINISSILGLRVGVQQTSYAVSKAGLTQLTKMMALELARNNIRVNAIAPGYIQSEMTEDFFNTTEGRNYMKKIPQRRYGNPEHLDGVILLLASEASSFMTGSIIPVDGGHLINPI
jgi:NAD(P)-dependent dehydrogenase (short-subunit alcohol dehydrogenase family)